MFARRVADGRNFTGSPARVHRCFMPSPCVARTLGVMERTSTAMVELRAARRGAAALDAAHAKAMSDVVALLDDARRLHDRLRSDIADAHRRTVDAMARLAFAHAAQRVVGRRALQVEDEIRQRRESGQHRVDEIVLRPMRATRAVPSAPKTTNRAPDACELAGPAAAEASYKHHPPAEASSTQHPSPRWRSRSDPGTADADDEFLAALRRAIEDETPLGPDEDV